MEKDRFQPAPQLDQRITKGRIARILPNAIAGPVLAVAVTIAGCGGDSHADFQSPTSNPQSSGEHIYPQAAISSFTASCEASSGGQKKYCDCTLHEIQKKYDYEQFVRLDIRMRNTGQIPEELSGIIAKCTK